MNEVNKFEYAVAYVRMSTDHQKYSTSNQLSVIEKYASEKGLEIIETFADEGKSGLQIKGRESLERLFSIVESGSAKFSHILVYDISRWGRFQDADEAAYYEFRCKKFGIKIHYCAETFPNDGSLIANLSKGLKRVMAGEYCRELSEKVFRGQCNLIRLGFRQGGQVGYGLRRALVDEKGVFKGIILGIGERKSIQTDRVIQVLGPDEEVANVKWIYSMFVNEMKSEREIASILNEKGIKTDLGRNWTSETVNQVLTNEKYIGNSVFNKTSSKLKGKTTKNPPEEWIRCDNAFEPLIELHTFIEAQAIIKVRSRKFSDEELLDKLKHLYLKNRIISGTIIDKAEDIPSSGVYIHRFGSLLKAYEKIGYTPLKNYAYLKINKHIREMHGMIFSEILDGISKNGTEIEYGCKKSKVVNKEVKLDLIVSKCQRMPGSGVARWNISFPKFKVSDFTILVRLNSDNLTIKDYYIFSRFDVKAGWHLHFNEDNGIFWDMFRFEKIDWFFEYFGRIRLDGIK